jgi:DNA ligase-1
VLGFARTAEAIGATSSTLQKTRVLAEYLKQLPPAELRVATTYMTGRPFSLADRRTLNLGWAAIAKTVEKLSGAGRPQLADSFLRHSDLGDWAFEMLQGRTLGEDVSLASVAAAVDAIQSAPTTEARLDGLSHLVERLDPLSAKYLVKILAGDLRIGLQQGLVEAAIAVAFDVPAERVRRLHMLTGDLAETAELCRRGEVDAASVRLFQPIRFMLASPVETAAEAMERVRAASAWTEEKYDGVRCQLHRDAARTALYSRDLRETTLAFPELAEAAASLPHSVLMDGEVLAHRDGAVLRFFELQRRLGRKVVTDKLLREVPVVFVAFDLLYLDGEPLLEAPLRERRALLEELRLRHPFLLARVESAGSPADLDRIFAETRERGNEGLMVKDPESQYSPGRRGMAWLKLKRPLATLDVVVTAVEWGHGKRRGVLSDYTFAVRDESTNELVNIGKAYSGLTDAEIAEMTQHFLGHTVRDYGRRREVEPETVLEVAFDSIQHSSRHRSGYALRFPRILRIRDDKRVPEIDTVARVRELYDRYFGGSAEVGLDRVAAEGTRT